MQNVMETARGLVDKIGDLPPIPAVMMKSLEMLGNPDNAVKKIQDQISIDQSLTAYILKIANSPLYGMRTEVSTLSHAITLMGYNTVRSVLLSFLARGYFHARGSRMVQSTLWKHSLAAAVFGKAIAEATGRIPVEETFIASLLHDIGKGVIFHNRTAEYEQVCEREFNSETSSVEAEMAVFGFTHVEVGYLVMKKWGFSTKIVETEVFHHQSQESDGSNLLVPAVSLANKLCHLNGYAFAKGHPDLFEIERFGLSLQTIEEIQEKARLEIDRYLEIFA